MKNIQKLIILVLMSVVILVVAIGIGSVSIPPIQTANILTTKLFGINFLGLVDEMLESIVWQIRFPRTILAYISGAGLAISGVIMQSILRNPLASSYTLGVSSGAALGASIAIMFNITIFGFFTLPIFGLSFGLMTVFLAMSVAVKIDRNLQNNSIILTGMAFTMFAGAMITIIMSFAGEQLQRLVFWQMGSFSMKTAEHALALFPMVLVGFIMILLLSREMDIMTFGDEQAMISGVETKKVKILLLSLSAIITGSIVSMVGIIGFVDLFTPHIARKIFGSRHKYVIPASALLGGAFMVLCDLLARTLVSPVELPVGAVTSAIGAPFFIYLYFSKRKKIK